MIINKSEFITSAVRREQYPEDGLNEVAFVGRSNVGKSSIINALTKSPYTFFLQTTEKFGDKQMNDLDWDIVIAKLNKILENTNCYLLVS